MATKKRDSPRAKPAPRADLSRTTPAEGAGILARSGGLGIEPVLLAIRVGLCDDDLGRIVATVEERLAALAAAAQIIAAATLKVGDPVVLGHNLRPLYLHGKAARVVARDGDMWIVRLETPVGRFKDADLRVSAVQLANVTDT